MGKGNTAPGWAVPPGREAAPQPPRPAHLRGPAPDLPPASAGTAAGSQPARFRHRFAALRPAPTPPRALPCCHGTFRSARGGGAACRGLSGGKPVGRTRADAEPALAAAPCSGPPPRYPPPPPAPPPRRAPTPRFRRRAAAAGAGWSRRRGRWRGTAEASLAPGAGRSSSSTWAAPGEVGGGQARGALRPEGAAGPVGWEPRELGGVQRLCTRYRARPAGLLGRGFGGGTGRED